MEHDVFEAHRPLLSALAYRMLGSVADAEDVVQDAYLRARDVTGVRDPKAFLVTTVTRLSIDKLRSAQRRRESYVGPWLPEPLLGTAEDAAAPVERAETLSLAFLVVLETLSPAERAAFLLHDVFGFAYPEVAGALGRSRPATRQLVHRARRALESRRPRSDASREEHREILQRFVAACSGHDVDGLAALLAHDAVAQTDGGGEAQAARRPIAGRDRVARFLVGVTKQAPPGMRAGVVSVNGRDGLLIQDGDAPLAVVDLVVEGGLVREVLVVTAPSKLAGAMSAAL